MTSVINAAHAHHTRVVLTISRVRLDERPGGQAEARSSAARPRDATSPARRLPRSATAERTA